MANSGVITPVLLLALIGTIVIALMQPIAGDRWDLGNTTLGNTTGQSNTTILGNATFITVQGNMTIQISNIMQPQDVSAKDEAKEVTIGNAEDKEDDEYEESC